MPNSQAYFKKTETYLAENEEKSVKTGDMVIIRTLEGAEKKTRDVTHRVQVDIQEHFEHHSTKLGTLHLLFATYSNRKRSSSLEI